MRLEHGVRLAFCRSDAAALGPEKVTGEGWYCPCPTVQLIERRKGGGGPRFVVWVFFAGRRVDLRFPPIGFDTRQVALEAALFRLSQAGGEPVTPGNDGGLDLARSGVVVGLTVFC